MLSVQQVFDSGSCLCWAGSYHCDTFIIERAVQLMEIKVSCGFWSLDEYVLHVQSVVSPSWMSWWVWAHLFPVFSFHPSSFSLWPFFIRQHTHWDVIRVRCERQWPKDPSFPSCWNLPTMLDSEKKPASVNGAHMSAFYFCLALLLAQELIKQDLALKLEIERNVNVSVCVCARETIIVYLAM